MKETRFLDYIICFLVSAIIVFIFRDGERVAVDIVVFIVIGFLFQGVLSYIRDEEMYFFIHQIPKRGKQNPERIFSLLVHMGAIVVILLKVL